MEKYPELSKDQVSRLQSELIRLGYAKNGVQARKMTSSWKRCKEVAVDICAMYDGYEVSSLDDIFDLYLVDDVFESKPIDKEKELVQIVSGDNEVKRRSRGKGKKPEKVMYPIRLEVDQLTRLKDLGGNVSAHIRRAIDAYLSSHR